MNQVRLNQLRAAVLGANDGIISVSTALVAIIGILGTRELILTAVAILFAGAISMAAGEYVSVSAQVNHEVPVEGEVSTSPQAPLHAASASFLAFLTGGTIPALLSIFTENSVIVVIAALALLATSAALTANKKAKIKSTVRLALVGSFALGISLLANVILHQLGV